MSRLKEGDRVTDGSGARGVVRKVERWPATLGTGPREDVYVDWLPSPVQLVPTPEALP